MTTAHPPLAYSVAQAAAIANLGRSTLYKAIANGDLVARKGYGRRTIILGDEFRAFLARLPTIHS